MEIFRACHLEWQDRYKLMFRGRFMEDVYRAEGITSAVANALSSQSQIAYRSAIMWVITRDIAYANIAKTILNSWSYTLQSFSGSAAKLCILRYGNLKTS